MWTRKEWSTCTFTYWVVTDTMCGLWISYKQWKSSKSVFCCSHCVGLCMELQLCKGLRGDTSSDEDFLLVWGPELDNASASMGLAAAFSAASAASACCIKKSSHWSAKESSAAALADLGLGLVRERAPATLPKTPLRCCFKPTRALSSSTHTNTDLLLLKGINQ